jgi:hypothetical protein
MISEQIPSIKNIEYLACDRYFNFSNFIPIEGTTNFNILKFGEKNMINGKIKYDCRNDISK